MRFLIQRDLLSGDRCNCEFGGLFRPCCFLRGNPVRITEGGFQSLCKLSGLTRCHLVPELTQNFRQSTDISRNNRLAERKSLQSG